jgi:hypothetical protein
MPSLQPTIDSPVTDWPLYWFARLEKAVEQGDHQTAAESQQQLARLGVRVSYGKPHPTEPAMAWEGVRDVD